MTGACVADSCTGGATAACTRASFTRACNGRFLELCQGDQVVKAIDCQRDGSDNMRQAEGHEAYCVARDAPMCDASTSWTTCSPDGATVTQCIDAFAITYPCFSPGQFCRTGTDGAPHYIAGDAQPCDPPTYLTHATVTSGVKVLSDSAAGYEAGVALSERRCAAAMASRSHLRQAGTRPPATWSSFTPRCQDETPSSPAAAEGSRTPRRAHREARPALRGE